MLPTLATINIASAGHATIATDATFPALLRRRCRVPSRIPRCSCPVISVRIRDSAMGRLLRLGGLTVEVVYDLLEVPQLPGQ